MENAIDIQKKSPWSHRLARQLLTRALGYLSKGYLQLTDGDKSWQFGDPEHPLHGEIEVLHADFYPQVLGSGSIGAAESYIKGQWQSPNLTTVVEIFARNLELLDQLEGFFNWFNKPLQRISHRRKANTIDGAKQNILAHYDIGNDLYQQFLDPDMLYSSAIYPTPETSLTEAQQYKLQMICERLQLKPGMHLLEIGTGWGALAMYAAKHYGVHVTTTTISDAQYSYAKQNIEAAGLAEQITLLKHDYRLLEGQYDRLVSIEMIEAVGHAYLPGFFAKLNSLLKDDGLMLLQAITIDERRYDRYRNSVDFIQKYIFPGGCLPSLTHMIRLLGEQGNMQLRQLWDFGQDYATTLKDWRSNFEKNLQQIRQLGYHQEFIRMWLFYFHYCEGGFRAGSTSVVHLLARKKP